jgi:hypothetical protein
MSGASKFSAKPAAFFFTWGILRFAIGYVLLAICHFCANITGNRTEAVKVSREVCSEGCVNKIYFPS